MVVDTPGVLHMDVDMDHTWQGWLIFCNYLMAALFCIRHGWNKASPLPREEVKHWKLWAILLFLLGLNKQLDLQTWMISVGRLLAREQGWLEYRRQVQLLFVACFTGVVGVGVIWWGRRHLAFYGTHRSLTAGLGLILFYVLIRAADMDHVFESWGWQPFSDQWFWIVELLGTALAVIGTYRFEKRE